MDEISAVDMVMWGAIASERSLLHGYKSFHKSIEQVPDEVLRDPAPNDVSFRSWVQAMKQLTSWPCGSNVTPQGRNSDSIP